MKLAIVEADRVLGDVLSFVAKRRGHQALCVTSLDRLLDRLPFEPNVIIASLDANDPPAPGWMAPIIGAYPDADVIVTLERPSDPLPARLIREGVREVVRAPYNPVELVLAAEGWRATRAKSQSASEPIRVADLSVALEECRAEKNGATLELTNLELRLLFCLCEHSPRLTPMERLLSFGWQSLDEPSPGLVKTHISHIRRKLEAAGGVPLEIRSRPSVGYALAPGSSPAD
ncbi:MAG: winged helix-turn-helix domain-containing protein [Dehalococcoidia bacterium]